MSEKANKEAREVVALEQQRKIEDFLKEEALHGGIS